MLKQWQVTENFLKTLNWPKKKKKKLLTSILSFRLSPNLSSFWLCLFVIHHSQPPYEGGEGADKYLLRFVFISIPWVLSEEPNTLPYLCECWALPRKFSFDLFLITDLVISVYWVTIMCLGLWRREACKILNGSELCVFLWSASCNIVVSGLLSLGHFYFVVLFFSFIEVI